MNRLVKDWIAALRSGGHKQTSRFLYKEGRHCATGVLGLCAGMLPYEDGDYKFGMYYEDWKRDFAHYTSYLPQAVIRATGLPSAVIGAVVRKNDAGLTFARIADYIQEQARAA